MADLIDEALERALPCEYGGTRDTYWCDRLPRLEGKRCMECDYRPAVRAAFQKLLEPLRGRVTVEHSDKCDKKHDAASLMGHPYSACICARNKRQLALDALIASVSHE
jgi:hypothetical protein